MKTESPGKPVKVQEEPTKVAAQVFVAGQPTKATLCIVDAMRQRDRRHRHARLEALPHDIALVVQRVGSVARAIDTNPTGRTRS